MLHSQFFIFSWVLKKESPVARVRDEVKECPLCAKAQGGKGREREREREKERERERAREIN